MWDAIVVEPGTRVRVEAPRRGLRSYVAFNGTLDAGRVLGSVAPDPLLGAGRTLQTGDRLSLPSWPAWAWLIAGSACSTACTTR